MRAIQFALISMMATTSAASKPPDNRLPIAARKLVPFKNYQLAKADLNGDRRPELFVYTSDLDYCGTGGCALVILSPARHGYRFVLRATVVTPIVGIAATKTRGWYDVVVGTDDGPREYQMRLRFNGTRYPSNPSTAPAVRFRGRIKQALITEFLA